MTKKPFRGIDEFTSARIRKDAAAPTSLDAVGLGRVVRTAEIDLLASTDPFEMAAAAEGTSDPSPAAHIAAHKMRSAMISARLELAGDLREGMRPDEVREWFEGSPFRLALLEPNGRDSGFFAVWADPATGYTVAGTVNESGRADLDMAFQWSPDLDEMNETLEAEVTERLCRIAGGGYANLSWSNPDRPELNHSTLHYSRSYPDIGEDERKAWEADFRAIPASILRERGKWIATVSARVTAGLLTPYGALCARGRFVTPWTNCQAAGLMLDGLFGAFHDRERAEDRLDRCEPWFLDIVSDARVQADVPSPSNPNNPKP